MSNTEQSVTPSGCQASCSAPTGDGGYLCKAHTEDLRRELLSVSGTPGQARKPWATSADEQRIADQLADELDVTITRQARTARPAEGGRSSERPLPWNENASARAFEMNATLNAWALDTSKLGEDERDQLIRVHHSDTAALAAWLVRNLHTLRMHPEAGTAHDEILNAIREARRAIDRASDPVPFGECGQIFEEGTVCREILYGQLDRHQVTCKACGTSHATRPRLEWMLEHLRGMLSTLPDLVVHASLAGKRTTEDKLRLMVGRGRFSPVGTMPDGRPIYRVAEALKALDDKGKHRPKVAGAA